MSKYIVIVYHHGGILIRDEDGVMTYINGRVDSLPEMDIDYCNICDLDTLFKQYGYEKCKRMMWLQPGVPDLEQGLRPLSTDSDVCAMCEAALGNVNEIHVYFEDCISIPEFASPQHDSEEDNVINSAHNEDHEEVDNGVNSHEGCAQGDDGVKENEDHAQASGDLNLHDDGIKENEDHAQAADGLNLHDDGINSDHDEESAEDAGNGFEDDSADDDHTSSHLDSYESAEDEVYKVRVRAKCSVEDCEWMVYCSWNTKQSTFQVKTFNETHTCCRVFKNKRATRDWVAKKLEKRILTQPKMTKTEAFEHMKEEYNVHLDMKKVSKALKKAKGTIEGCEKEQYGRLREYLAELLRSNPGSSCKLQVTPQPIPQALPIFDRMYIFLDAYKKGFKDGCRPLIGLNGCFLKGYYGGQLLSAVGEDANKQFYVIAYAVVDSETKDNWKWFLTLLQEDLGDHGVFGWNFISDQQKIVLVFMTVFNAEICKCCSKPCIYLYTFWFLSTMGLVPALKEIMPGSHHRFCVQHVWKNFIKQWKDKETRVIVWECARCTTVPQFEKVMLKLKTLNEPAWKYLDNIHLSCWVKAYYSHWPKCDNITNNMPEVWNAKIVNYRSKPIMTLCEELRCYIMRRMAAHKRILQTFRGKIAPAQQKRLDQLKLTGLPCEHAIAAIAHKNEPVENNVHQWLTVDVLHATYEHTLNLVNSQQYWPACDALKPLPPRLKMPIGRPKKHRKKDPTEELMKTNKKLRKTYTVQCSKCGETGHYPKTCKGPAGGSKSKTKPVNVEVGQSRTVEEIIMSMSQGCPALETSS
ncbi:uncharacterized protein LOC133291821 [Gastrolobium bilobum]|uniref:uncharacterized protein LOC133291821 n=1 Tax=Gastrolobium bilobum TaxID=150636 RepID=UPI002AB0F4C5|nr:uncharacterized protein LOC133291821 [Gastrolobium bilobum]